MDEKLITVSIRVDEFAKLGFAALLFAKMLESTQDIENPEIYSQVEVAKRAAETVISELCSYVNKHPEIAVHGQGLEAVQKLLKNNSIEEVVNMKFH
nr:MAG TPA: Immunoreactive 32 kDa antigen, adhesin, periodontitis, cell adhesion [Caudoviricetes sp.]